MTQQPNRNGASSSEVTPVEAWRRVREEGALLVDVREPEEYAEGHAEGVTSIPLSVFQEHYQELPHTGDLLFICHTGYRSLMAATFMQRQGWQHTLNVAGGMDAWEAAALPIERGNPSTA